MRKKLIGALFALTMVTTATGLTFTEPQQADAAGDLLSTVLSKEITSSQIAEDLIEEETDLPTDTETEISQDTQASTTDDTLPTLSVASDTSSESINFTAKLVFQSAVDDHVILQLTNQETAELHIASQAYYMDQLGSAGSWDCAAQQETVVKAGETVYVDFYTAQAVAHGENSILAFYLQYEDQWFLAKVGERNGVECFLRHN